jgi:hypothetical protein
MRFVIPSGVENGVAWEAATWTGRPKAERTGIERIKSLGFSVEMKIQIQSRRTSA